MAMATCVTTAKPVFVIQRAKPLKLTLQGLSHEIDLVFDEKYG
jgi:hypothetical protein